MPAPVCPRSLARHEQAILDEWLRRQAEALGRRRDLLSEQDVQRQSTGFLNGLLHAASGGELDIGGNGWQEVKGLLGEMSTARSRQGFTPSETAMFVFSLKAPVFSSLRRELGKDADALADEMGRASALPDSLGLYTTEVYQKGREEVIARQQQELLELSTPVVRLWETSSPCRSSGP